MKNKTKQHYVWQRYLKEWATAGSVWCKRGDKIFPTDTINIGQERFFYKLNELTEKDINWIKSFIAKNKNKSLREANEGWIDLFNKAFEIKRVLSKKNISHQKIDEALDFAIKNLEEELHCVYENAGSSYLSRLLSKDGSFFSIPSDCIAFSHFISTQFMRTKKMQDTMIRQFVGNNDFNVNAVWPVLRHVLSLNIATSIFNVREKYSLVILENCHSLKFITSDQPVINTYAVGVDELAPINNHEFYYPVSPNLAVLLTDRPEYRRTTVAYPLVSTIEWLNSAIAEFSHEQIYADSKEVLAKH